MVETAKLSVSLTVTPAAVFPGQQVQLGIGLSCGSADLPLPALLDESGALQFEVFTAGGEPVDTVSAQDLVRRRGYGVEPTPDEENPEDEFPAGETVSLTFGLLDLFSLSPGDYLVAVAIRYKDTAAVSPRQSVKILPAATTAATLSTGQVCLPALHFLSRMDGETAARTQLSVYAAAGAGGLLEQFLLPEEVPGDAAVGRAAFGAPDDSDLDQLGWLAWIDNDGLALLRYAAEAGAGPILRPTLPMAISGLLGSPIHHQDGSLTLFVLHPETAGPELHKVCLERDGSLRSSVKNKTLPGRPGAAVMSVDGTAVRFLIDFPLEKMILNVTIEDNPKEGEEPVTIWVAGELTGLEDFLENESASVSCLALNGPKVSAILVAGEAKPFLLEASDGPVRPKPIELPALEDKESIRSSALTIVVENEKPFAALRTSTGRLFAGTTDEALALIEDADPESPVGPWIASDFADGLYLYYAGIDGLKRKRLYTLPPVVVV